MQAHRNGDVPTRPPAPESLEHRAQRTVRIQLVVCPPEEGVGVEELIERLDLPPRTVEPAVAALELVDLVERHGDVVRAGLPASYFEYLWRVRL